MGYRIVYAVALLALFASCNKLPNLKSLTNIKFDLPYSKEYAAPGIDSNVQLPQGGISYSFPAMAVATNSVEALQKYNVSQSQIVSAKLKAFSQQIFNSPDKYDFADSMQVFISAPGMPEVLMAYQNDIPKNTDSLAFQCTEENLKDYLLKDTVYLRLQGHFNKIPKAANYKSNFTVGMVTDLINDDK